MLTNKNDGHETPVWGLEPVCVVSACIDPRFRNTLRIYSTMQMRVSVAVGNVTILVEHLTVPLPIQTWAFITVANNETQAISTITPQP
ncbi:MAG TPA: hypothetical protein VEK79_12970 [Thermoanaerobaculia bacterium]|nr:hypothetical protein [Thermoanaerobaculia bacterium]